jgi:hypothetical protein
LANIGHCPPPMAPMFTEWFDERFSASGARGFAFSPVRVVVAKPIEAANLYAAIAQADAQAARAAAA